MQFELKKFMLISDYSNFGIALTDLKGEILYTNKYLARIHGYKPVELIGKNLSIFNKRDQLKYFNEDLGKTKFFNSHETWHIDKTGNEFPIQMNTAILHDDNNNPKYLAVYAIDISKKVEEKLSKDENLLKTYLESTPNAIIIIDLNDKIIDCNDKALEIHGFSSKDEIIGRDADSLIAEADLDKGIANKKELLQNGFILNKEVRLLKKNGEIFCAEVSGGIIKDVFNNFISLIKVTRDITQDRKTEELLKENERTAKVLIDTPIDLILLVDTSGIILEANITICNRMGKSYHEVINKSIFELFKNYDPKRVDYLIKRTISYYRPYRFEERYKETWYDVIMSPVFNEQKEIAKIAIFARDITDIKNIEIELKDIAEDLRKTSVSRDYFNNIINSMTESVFVIDETGKIKLTNKAGIKLLGIKKNNIIEKKIEEYFFEKDIICEYISKIKKNKNITNDNVSIIDNNNNKIPVMLSLSKLKDNKKIIGSICVVKDISELKTAEEKITHSEKRFDQIAENINEVFWISNNDKSILFYISPPFEKIWGRPVKELYENPKKWIDFVHPDDKNKIYSYLKKIEKSEWNEEYRIIKPGGEIRWIRERLFPIIKNNIIDHIIGIAVDITDYKKAQDEAELQRRKVLQADKLASLGELSAGLAHEISQPLTGIAMGIGNIKFDLNNHNIKKNELIKKCNTILEYVDRIKNIMSHIKIFSREQKSNFFNFFNINEAIQNALSLIKNQYKNHDIIINLNLEENIPKIYGNIYKLEQVILDLLNNSKFAIEEKNKKIKNKKYKKEIYIKTFYDDKEVFIEIYDNGVGIKNEHLNKIFDPFFTTKPIEEGTGLGLSIVYSLIKEMNGDISITSNYNEFTKCLISFLKNNKEIKDGKIKNSNM